MSIQPTSQLPVDILEDQQVELAARQQLEETKVEINSHIDDEISKHFSGLSGYMSNIHSEMRKRLRMVALLLSGNFLVLLAVGIILISISLNQ